MGRNFFCILLASMTLIACAPDDQDVRVDRNAGFRRAAEERSKVRGADYVQYVGYRLAEIRQIVQMVLAPTSGPTPLESDKNCGVRVVDRTEGGRRFVRFVTQNCIVARGQVESLQLKADGEEVIEVIVAADGAIQRLSYETVGPYMVGGEITKGEKRNSQALIQENREMVMDLVATKGSLRTYRLTYSAGMQFRQELQSKAYIGREEGQNLLNISGSIELDGATVSDIIVDSLRMTANVPREITERGRRARNDTPNRTFHRIDWIAKVNSEKGQPTEPIHFSEGCGWPLGALRVIRYQSTGGSNDGISSKPSPNVIFSEKGVEVPAANMTLPWLACESQADAASELANRIPYPLLFFK